MSPEELTRLTDAIYDAARRSGVLIEGEVADLLFVAASFTLLDCQFAIDSYQERDAFRDHKEAYLMKYGLLQALQNQIKATEDICAAVGNRRRIDRFDGVAAVLLTRHIVAGHPLRSNVDGIQWRHFHDRGTVHDPKVMRVMSFDADDPSRWTGRTIPVSKLIIDEAKAVEIALRSLISDDRLDSR